MTKRVYITGAAGFIGFHVAKALKAEGHEVFGCDNFNAYYSPLLKEARREALQAFGVEVERLELEERASLERSIDAFEPTHLLHLAAQAGVRASLRDPESYIRSNVSAFLGLLEILRERPHIPLIFASSSSVYGHNEKVPFSEEDPVTRPASLYAVTKRMGEEMAHVYHNLFGLSVTALRFFTVYGEWGRPDMAYFSFVEKILKGERISLFNGGDMERDFTYITDIVDGTIRALELAAPLEIFNLGNSQPVSLRRFVEIIEEATGKRADIEFLPMQQGDVLRTYANIQHSEERLQFAPKTPLEVGIPRFVAWYRSFYGI